MLFFLPSFLDDQLIKEGEKSLLVEKNRKKKKKRNRDTALTANTSHVTNKVYITMQQDIY